MCYFNCVLQEKVPQESRKIVAFHGKKKNLQIHTQLQSRHNVESSALLLHYTTSAAAAKSYYCEHLFLQGVTQMNSKLHCMIACNVPCTNICLKIAVKTHSQDNWLFAHN